MSGSAIFFFPGVINNTGASQPDSCLREGYISFLFLFFLKFRHGTCMFVCLLVCLTSQEHASVSQGWTCSDNFTCCHTEIVHALQLSQRGVYFFFYLSFDMVLPCLFVGWLLHIPATCECISGTDLLRQFYVLPHWDCPCLTVVSERGIFLFFI